MHKQWDLTGMWKSPWFGLLCTQQILFFGVSLLQEPANKKLFLFKYVGIKINQCAFRQMSPRPPNEFFHRQKFAWIVMNTNKFSKETMGLCLFAYPNELHWHIAPSLDCPSSEFQQRQGCYPSLLFGMEV